MARKSRKNQESSVSTEVKGKTLRTVLYVRLSEEDERKIQADTVENQIAFLKDYIADKPYLNLVKVYTDRGVTGTKFDRPDFNAMIADMRQGKFECIVVKDLSRLGRNYLEAGEYLEKIFPFFNIRFIAVTDNYDSACSNPTEDGLIVPLKNLINEAYAKDVSRKISSAFSMMQQQGKYIGGTPPYGYLRDPEDKYHLIVDESLRPLIVRMFEERASGKSLTAIARSFNEEQVPSPMQYRISKGFLKTDKYKGVMWTQKLLKSIMKSRIYIGEMVLHKEYEALYKGQERINVPEDEWLRFPNAHEAIISEELFDRVNELLEEQRTKSESVRLKYKDVDKKENIFNGILYCADCGNSMGLYRRTMKLKTGLKTYYSYTCRYTSTYRSQGDKSKNTKMSVLEDVTMSQIKEHMSIYLTLKDELCRLNKSSKAADIRLGYEEDKEVLIDKLRRAKSVAASLYADYADGILSESDYKFAKIKNVKDIENYQSRIQELECILLTYNEQYSVDTELDAQIADHKDFTELTEKIIKAFISRINCFDKNRFEFHFRFQDKLEELKELVNSRREEIA